MDASCAGLIHAKRRVGGARHAHAILYTRIYPGEKLVPKTRCPNESANPYRVWRRNDSLEVRRTGAETV
eukprot:343011-Pyramimonas_sp.AAC.3